MKFTALVDTYFKAAPIQSTALKKRDIPDQIIPIKGGTELEIVDHQTHEGEPGTDTGDHYYIQLAEPVEGSQGIRWFVYSLHAQIEGLQIGNNPQDTPAPAPRKESQEDTGPKITLPGISRLIGIYEPVYWDSNFSWSEMTKGGQRLPVSSRITENIVKLCRYMDEVRAFLGDKPIIVNSGYRDPVSNQAVGGATQSRHLEGDAVDFYVKGENVVDTFKKLKSYHTRGGLAVGNGFVHLDLRPGGPVRWHYPNAPKVALW